ncbi:MAG: AmmeMemoRadiSam system radical SAM enzyme [Candidatus Omnitrophota bacterium]
MKEALFYQRKADQSVECCLCNHGCYISLGAKGLCGVRENKDGSLYTLSYGRLIAQRPDPIEKKPLYHFLPGILSYSIAAAGCNFKCDYCQNWAISQKGHGQGALTEPSFVIGQALNNDCRSISYTYTEPTIYFEFAYECAKLAKQADLYNVFVTNGYFSKDALEYITPYLNAVNVDLKSFSEAFYAKHCRASLKPVLDNIALMKRLGIWVEVTTLIIPGLNDSAGDLSRIASFICSIDKNIPWHISRFHPDYNLTSMLPTSIETLERAYRIGKDKGLNYIYIGNVLSEYGENTYCPGCTKTIVERKGFSMLKKNITQGKCSFCGTRIAGIW